MRNWCFILGIFAIGGCSRPSVVATSPPSKPHKANNDSLVLYPASNDSPPDAIGKAELVRVRVKPYTWFNGTKVHMVYVDWKNTGKVAVNEVKADITPYDEGGRPLPLGTIHYAIFKDFTAFAVPPSKVYVTPNGSGVSLPGNVKPGRVEVRITSAVQKWDSNMPPAMQNPPR
jgi:hypothetical protein